MPLYEYTCKHCAKEFELLVRNQEIPTCPHCASKDLEKKMSSFSSSSAGGDGTACEYGPAAGHACGGGHCCGGHCSH